ncbi:hypothetical protein B0H13DRAFT_2321560 [Mycena leptocephala]|nr:hypothetical protein B0H13DRAFT_2321560 [Mycena leptocephala]
MSPIDLVTTILVKPNVYPANDKRGTKKLFAWFEGPGMDHLIHDIHAEMDLLSEIFRFSTSEVTPESLCDFDFERDVTELVTMIQAQLAKTRSQNNNLCAIPCSLYFLSSVGRLACVTTVAPSASIATTLSSVSASTGFPAPSGVFVVTGIYTTCLTVTFDAAPTASASTGLPIESFSVFPTTSAFAVRAAPSLSTASSFSATPSVSAGSSFSAAPSVSVGSSFSAAPSVSVGSSFSAAPSVSVGSSFSAAPSFSSSASTVIASSSVPENVAVFTTCMVFLPGASSAGATSTAVASFSSASASIVALSSGVATTTRVAPSHAALTSTIA